MEKLSIIVRTIAILLLTVAWLLASTASLIHTALHDGGVHDSVSHHHGLQFSSTVVQVDTPDTHATSAVIGCFFCINGSLVLLLAVVALFLSLPRFFRHGFSWYFATIAYHRFLLPSLRAPPQLG